jgi:hypothetical protein
MISGSGTAVSAFSGGSKTSNSLLGGYGGGSYIFNVNVEGSITAEDAATLLAQTQQEIADRGGWASGEQN